MEDLEQENGLFHRATVDRQRDHAQINGLATLRLVHYHFTAMIIQVLNYVSLLHLKMYSYKEIV